MRDSFVLVDRSICLEGKLTAASLCYMQFDFKNIHTKREHSYKLRHFSLFVELFVSAFSLIVSASLGVLSRVHCVVEMCAIYIPPTLRTGTVV